MLLLFPKTKFWFVSSWMISFSPCSLAAVETVSPWELLVCYLQVYPFSEPIISCCLSSCEYFCSLISTWFQRKQSLSLQLEQPREIRTKTLPLAVVLSQLNQMRSKRRDTTGVVRKLLRLWNRKSFPHIQRRQTLLPKAARIYNTLCEDVDSSWYSSSFPFFCTIT